MLIEIDRTSETPLYQQLRDQIVFGIARGALKPGEALPSVRALASDLGINLHTVNRAYAVLKSEGYVIMHGRSKTYVADLLSDATQNQQLLSQQTLRQHLHELALEHRARGGSEDDFLQLAQEEARRAYKGNQS